MGMGSPPPLIVPYLPEKCRTGYGLNNGMARPSDAIADSTIPFIGSIPEEQHDIIFPGQLDFKDDIP
jgi:hypothetical protein